MEVFKYLHGIVHGTFLFKKQNKIKQKGVLGNSDFSF